MPTTLKIAPVSLDFDSLKASLKTYLKSQTQFRDYNFEGSGLAILLDVLASNTQYNAFLINMLANESFIDSAMLRSNVVSLAKMLNYVPASATAPVANVRVTVSNVPGNPAYITIDRTYRFTTQVDGETYAFVPSAAQTIQKDSNNKYISAFNIYQGAFVQNSYTFDATTNTQKFEIPNSGVDLGFLKVFVYPGGSKTGAFTEYTLATDISRVNPNSNVFFVQENQRGNYEVYFGDDVIGNKPSNNSLIVLDYLFTNAETANSASSFTKTTAIAGSTDIIITTLDAASGGAPREDIDRIRILAPKFNTTQNRAVTVDDFKTIIKKEYPSVDSVAVWGGEDADPVAYGQVFAALKPKQNVTFSETVKAEIAENLKNNYMVVAVRPVIVNPDYIFVLVNSEVRYDGINTNRTAPEIVALVNSAVDIFFEENLNDFEKTLRYSKLVAAIDNAASEIKGNYTTLKLKKVFTPTLNTPRDYIINFSNPVAPYSLTTNSFIIQGTTYKLKDVPVGTVPHSTGTVVVYRTVGNNDVIQQNVGTVDYSTGRVTLNAFAPNGISIGRDINVIVSPSTSTLSTDISTLDYNIYTNSREQIIVRDTELAVITAISEVHSS